ARARRPRAHGGGVGRNPRDPRAAASGRAADRGRRPARDLPRGARARARRDTTLTSLYDETPRRRRGALGVVQYRGDKIRTCNHYVPNVELYQVELLPALFSFRG